MSSAPTRSTRGPKPPTHRARGRELRGTPLGARSFVRLEALLEHLAVLLRLCQPRLRRGRGRRNGLALSAGKVSSARLEGLQARERCKKQNRACISAESQPWCYSCVHSSVLAPAQTLRRAQRRPLARDALQPHRGVHPRRKVAWRCAANETHAASAPRCASLGRPQRRPRQARRPAQGAQGAQRTGAAA